MRNVHFVLLAVTLLLATSCVDRKGLIEEGVSEFSKFELGTVEYTVIKAVAADYGMTYKDYDISLGDKKILYSMVATLKAGVDLDQFDADKAIQMDDTKITLTLPKAKLLMLNIAPSSIKYEFSKVSWYRSDFTEKDRNEILKLGEQSIRDAVPELGILKDAEKNAVEFFESFLKNMGFTTVNIKFE